jgi:hypothetical protein
VEEHAAPESKEADAMPINGACESGPIIADLTTPSPAQTSYESVISFSSNSFGNSDSISGKCVNGFPVLLPHLQKHFFTYCIRFIIHNYPISFDLGS